MTDIILRRLQRRLPIERVDSAAATPATATDYELRACMRLASHQDMRHTHTRITTLALHGFEGGRDGTGAACRVAWTMMMMSISLSVFVWLLHVERLGLHSSNRHCLILLTVLESLALSG